MNKKLIAGRFMLAGGSIEILIGLIHFLMPIQMVGAREIGNLPSNYKNLIILVTVSVGLCLVVFGALSIYFSRWVVQGDRTAWIFGISQGVLWLGRTILELLFPVTVPLLFLGNPTVLVLPMVFLLGLLFLLPMWLFRNEFGLTQ